MTSRRSRLKAVTNLPVRRKPLVSQGNGNEAVDNLPSEKSYTSSLKGDEFSTVTHSTKLKHVDGKFKNDTQNKNIGNESITVMNCADNFQNNENSIKEIVITKTEELIDSEFVENSNDFSKTCNLSSKTESGGSAINVRNNKRFKPNLISPSVKERVQARTPEKIKGSDNSRELDCTTICDNSNTSTTTITTTTTTTAAAAATVGTTTTTTTTTNNNNNIVEDGLKCYTVLTSKNVAINSLTEYTITPLTPCSNTFVDSNISEVGSPQEYEEVQVYTDLESPELFINNAINENCESIIQTECLEPVLTNLTNYNSDRSGKNISYESLNSNFAEPKSFQVNFVAKPKIKNKIHNIKNNFGGNDDYGVKVTQIKDSSALEITIPSGSQNVSSDLHSQKQAMSGVRRRRSKFNDFTKKLADAKREFQKKYDKTKPDRSTLKMIDLIFYNPTTNPMESKNKCEKRDTTAPTSEIIHDLLVEEKVDEPDSVDCQSKFNLSDNCDTDNTNKMPVPQVKIGVDGEIILDEKSLIIETTEAKKGREGLQNSIPIFEDREYKVSYYRGKSKKTRDWADFETKRFYKALNTIGPDFTLMQKYFPKRSRLELKNKFKREERLNRNLIDKALNNPAEFDMTQLEKDLAIEKEAEQEELDLRLSKIIKHTTRKPRVKTSFLSREIIETDDESDESQSFDISSKGLSDNEKNKKEKEFDFVFQKLLMKESKKCILPEVSSSNAFQSSDSVT